MPKQDFIKLYADGTVETQITREVVYPEAKGDNTQLIFQANGDYTNMTVCGSSFSPNCDKPIDGKKLFKSIKKQLIATHYDSFDSAYAEDQKIKGGQ